MLSIPVDGFPNEISMNWREGIVVSAMAMAVLGLLISPMAFTVYRSNEMVKQRREEIKEQGYKAGMLGFATEICPYESGYYREIWMAGFVDGKIQAIWWQKR